MPDKCDKCGVSDRYHATECDRDQARRFRANARRREAAAGRREAYESHGMTRVRGAVSGQTYYE